MKWCCVAVACLGTLGAGGCKRAAGADAGISDAATADAGSAEAAATINGTVLLDGLCDPAADASVSLLGGGLATVTDADGRYQLTGVPQGAVLQVTGPGLVPTLSAAHNFTAQTESVDLAAVRQTTFDWLPLVSGLPANPDAGVVLLALVNGQQFPVGDVTVSLEQPDGGPAAGERRYAFSSGGVVLFDDGDGGLPSTEADLGLVIFFDVPAGSYRARANRGGFIFPPLQLEVAAGAATVAFYPGDGDGGTVPVAVTGTVQSTPPSCETGTSLTPLPGARVLVQAWDDGGSFEGTTDDAGTFQVAVPIFRRRIDLTVSAAGYPTTRTRGFCALPTAFNTTNVELFNSALESDWLNIALGDQLPAADAGYIQAVVGRQSLTGATALAGATLRLEPSVASPVAYDLGWGTVETCASKRCASAADCATTERCEGGECLLGPSGPLCDPCDAGACAAGYQAEFVNNLATGSPTCHCLPARSSCPPPEACPSGTFCFPYGQCSGGPELDACLPEGQRPIGTEVNSSGVAYYAMIANVPEGIYRLIADTDGGLLSAWVRVSPGIAHAVEVTDP